MTQINQLFLGLTFVAFVSGASTAEPCRPACPSPEAVYSHPRDCTKFFHCAYNIPFEKSCPRSLYFSPDLLRCDFPAVANCRADPSNPCVAPTIEATQHPSTDGGYGLNTSSTTSSPHPTSPSVSPGKEPTSSETPEDCRPACPTPEALLAHPRDCGKYYHCAFSVANEKVCSAGLHFSVSLALCDYPELAQCTATEDAPCDDVITVAPTEPPRNLAGASHTRVKRGISVNVTLATTPSANGIAVSTAAPNVTLTSSIPPSLIPELTLAPNGTAFLSLVPNGTADSTSAPKMTTSQAAVCHPTCGPRRYLFGHPWYCDKFFLCSNSKAIEMTCPEGLYFSAARYRCEYPYMSDCFASPEHPCY